MPANGPWFFTSFNLPQVLPQIVTLQDSDLAHHLKHGMRLRLNEPLVLIDPVAAQPVLASLNEISGANITVTLKEILLRPNRPALQITAVVALLKEQKWDALLQKLTEIGVAHIVPMYTERTVVLPRAASGKQARWESIMRHAAQQCQRPDLPKLHSPIAFDDWQQSLQEPDTEHLCWLASEWDGPTALPPLAKLKAAKAVTFVIGPEGGWTQAELDAMAQRGLETVHLGAKILRAETAAIYLASVIDYAALLYSGNDTSPA